MSHSGSSNRPISGEAERQPPAETERGTPRDGTRPDKGEATGGPGQFDLVSRLRRWTHAVDAALAGDLMDEAADEIERLRLTDAERFVLREMRDNLADEDDVACNEIAAVIDGLLDRTQAGEK